MNNTSGRIRTGVIGTGFMGSLHCRAYSVDNDSDFAGVFDLNKSSAADQASKYGVRVFDSVDELLNNVDAVSIAAPTTLHCELGIACAKSKKHLLMEKPIAASLKEAAELSEAVKRSGIVFAVGYIEKFNPAVICLSELLKGKKLISFEAVRQAPPSPRANDVSVVLDLMIHDLDILLALKDYESPSQITADGRKVLRDVIEEASCTLTWKDGFKAEVCASKVSDKKLRTIKAAGNGIIVEADLISRKVKTTGDGVVSETEASGPEPIRAEISDFLKAVKEGALPVSDIRSGRLSFETAKRIEQLIEGR